MALKEFGKSHIIEKEQWENENEKKKELFFFPYGYPIPSQNIYYILLFDSQCI